MENVNLQRMIQLAEEFFGTRNDPTQIAVDDSVREKLHAIHPASMTEETNPEGPIAWVLMFPTTRTLKEQFIAQQITERELLDLTPPGERYQAVYLCSALVLPEFRKQGIATRLVTGALTSMAADHPIESLFYWAFSGAGEQLARTVAGKFQLPLYRRPD